jgi:hypothetical protein
MEEDSLAETLLGPMDRLKIRALRCCTMSCKWKGLEDAGFSAEDVEFQFQIRAKDTFGTEHRSSWGGEQRGAG